MIKNLSLLGVLLIFLVPFAASASVIWECNGMNVESFQIHQEGNEFKGSVSWDYGAGGAIDEGQYTVHQILQKKGSASSVTYMDGTDVQTSHFVLTIFTSSLSSDRGSYQAQAFAITPEAPNPFSEKLSCISTTPSSFVSTDNSAAISCSEVTTNACADPNSNEGIIAWGCGICGPLPGGSN